MPPKKEAKKGAVQGNYKAGKALKDILPAGSKPNREGKVFKLEEEPNVSRKFQYEPMPQFAEWPGNDEAHKHDFTTGCEKGEEGEFLPFEDKNCVLHLPPSFNSFIGKGPLNMMRPDAYIREVLYDDEKDRLKKEKRKQLKARKNIRMQNIFSAMGGGEVNGDVSEADQEMASKEIKLKIDKSALEVNPCCIQFLERLETEDEVVKRKLAEEIQAEMDKKAKKKPPAKGAKDEDPGDKPQMTKVPVENSLDLGFCMPVYTKWLTSQLQLAKDRHMVDVDSKEKIWQRIYPQENGAPVVSPTGKYWIKLRFMGKERLIEIDDTMPCDTNNRPIFARTINVLELWPQLLMKAICKVFSYKWFSPNSYYDKEVGDGSIINALTGMLPEHVKLTDFKGANMDMFRYMLTDDYYFGQKAFLTCYCDNEFRPKLPSQQTAQPNKKKGQSKMEATPVEMPSGAGGTSSPQKTLRKLKEAASLAISVTTGKKLNVNKPKSSNVIPGFGYAMMDMFENKFVDMDSICETRLEIVEEVRSPFSSPKKKERSPLRDGSITKEEYRRQRKDERTRLIEEHERMDREAPQPYQLLQVKTAVGRFPTINYVSPFSQEEIMAGKRCVQNHFKRPPEVERAMQVQFEAATATKTRRGKAFAISVSNLSPTRVEEEVNQLNQPSMSALEGQASQDHDEEMKEEIQPKSRAAGGIWLHSTDFPHSFTDVIVYHNMSKYENRILHTDVWADTENPYTPDNNDVYLKVELDEEAFNKYKEKKSLDAEMTLEGLQQHIEAENNLEDQTQSYPGETFQKTLSPDKFIVAFAPQPTKASYEVLPRYMCRLQTVDLDSSIDKGIDQRFLRYMESMQFRLEGNLATQKTLWLKPNVVAPQGYTLWAASNFRTITVVPKSEYMQNCLDFQAKQYTLDYLPLQQGRNHLFAKYDFKVPSEECVLNLNFNCTDKYLLDYMRIKIVEKADQSAKSTITFNNMQLENIKLPVIEEGYTLIVEGAMPYNTTEGTLTLDMLTNDETFELQEIVGCEPVEYTDNYNPSKYGIIFKEKIFTSPTDQTLASINVRLMQNGVPMSDSGLMKYFRLQILDNNKVVFDKRGWNQINLSNFCFRMNQGLTDVPNEESGEVKHNYVIQAIFDLNMWPEARTINSQTEGCAWLMKMFTSETVALIKDTDKEDREKALKVSWETNEAGRSEKATDSRKRFLLQKKQKAGEELTEEEIEFLAVKRERIRKKDLEELANNPKGGAKGKAPAKADPKAKGGKGAVVADKSPEEEVVRVLPKPEDHVNTGILTFLNHFNQPRLINVASKGAENRKRGDEEKAKINQERQAKREAEVEQHEAYVEARNQLKETRETFKEKLFEKVDNCRVEYKGQLAEAIEGRTGYRDIIVLRKEKENALIAILGQDKIDVAALTMHIEAAMEHLVMDRMIQRANKHLEWLTYCKQLEAMLATAVAEGVKENLAAIIERIEKEAITIEPKTLSDAKGRLAKMK